MGIGRATHLLGFWLSLSVTLPFSVEAQVPKQPLPTAQPYKFKKKRKEGMQGLDLSGRPGPDPVEPGSFRVSRVRVFSGFGLKNLIQNPKFSGGFGLGFRVGSNYARSSQNTSNKSQMLGKKA